MWTNLCVCLFVCLFVCLARERSRALAGSALSECHFLVGNVNFVRLEAIRVVNLLNIEVHFNIGKN